jgi:hypothetical protein
MQEEGIDSSWVNFMTYENMLALRLLETLHA